MSYMFIFLLHFKISIIYLKHELSVSARFTEKWAFIIIT